MRIISPSVHPAPHHFTRQAANIGIAQTNCNMSFSFQLVTQKTNFTVLFFLLPVFSDLLTVKKKTVSNLSYNFLKEMKINSVQDKNMENLPRTTIYRSRFDERSPSHPYQVLFQSFQTRTKL